MTHKVVFEIEVDSENDNPEQAALEAAKTVQEWLHSKDDWQYYVQDTNTDKVYSVDLQEPDEDAVLEIVTKYEPLIK